MLQLPTCKHLRFLMLSIFIGSFIIAREDINTCKNYVLVSRISNTGTSESAQPNIENISYLDEIESSVTPAIASFTFAEGALSKYSDRSSPESEVLIMLYVDSDSNSLSALAIATDGSKNSYATLPLPHATPDPKSSPALYVSSDEATLYAFWKDNSSGDIYYSIMSNTNIVWSSPASCGFSIDRGVAATETNGIVNIAYNFSKKDDLSLAELDPEMDTCVAAKKIPNSQTDSNPAATYTSSGNALTENEITSYVAWRARKTEGQGNGKEKSENTVFVSENFNQGYPVRLSDGSNVKTKSQPVLAVYDRSLWLMWANSSQGDSLYIAVQTNNTWGASYSIGENNTLTSTKITMSAYGGFLYAAWSETGQSMSQTITKIEEDVEGLAGVLAVGSRSVK
ncbi:MAG: hypothetical protein J7647_11135 [Cyanobacteria bacterium SBLK]|nr:hypothetical protein [Cyanobacteria bacterium SBLK]